MENNSRVQISQELIGTWLFKIFQTKDFIEQMKKARNFSWPALYIKVEKNPKNNEFKNFFVELFENQIIFDLSKVSEIFLKMEEGGILCENSITKSISTNDNYQFYCQKNLIVSGQKLQMLWIEKIKRLFREITFSNNIYHELFNFWNEKIDVIILRKNFA